MGRAFRHIAGRSNELRRSVVRRRSLEFAGVLVAFLLAIAVTMPIPSLGGASVAVAAVQQAKSFIELMHQRSPGNRLVAHLAQTKHKKLALHERALPKIRKQPPEMAGMAPLPAVLPPALVDLFAPPAPMEMASLEGMPLGPLQAPLIAPPGFFLPPGGGFIVPPTETPTSPPIVTPPIVAQAVPEPRTWAMMLLGFSLLGWSLRRGPHREQTAA
jgi:hypothetical protein